MKRKLEIQTLIVLLCALGVAGSWIGIQIVKDRVGESNEAHELQFTTTDLMGLGPRSEVRCAGAVIGHVRKVTAEPMKDGHAQFMVIAGIGSDFTQWQFSPHGTVMSALVESALSPSWIELKIDATSSSVQAGRGKDGKLPVLGLARGPSDIDLKSISAQIEQVVGRLTQPRTAGGKSTMDQLGETIDYLDNVAASLDGRSPSTPPSAPKDPANPPPIDYILGKLRASADNLESATGSLKNTVGKGGELDRALVTLNESLLRFEKVSDETTKAINHLNLRVDSSVGKVNSVLDTLQAKSDRLGETFVGRMLIAKPDPKKATPPPQNSKKKSGR